MYPLPLVLVSAALAAAPAAQAPATDAPQKAPLTLPVGELSAADLARLVGRRLRCNILLAERELVHARPITLTEPVVLDAASALDTLVDLLYTVQLGVLTVDEDKRIYEVIASNGPRFQELAEQAVACEVEEVLARPNARRYVITSVALRHQRPAAVMNALRPMIALTGSGLAIGSGADGASLVVRGPQSGVAAAVRLMLANDKPVAPLPQQQALADRMKGIEERLAALEARLAELQKALAGR